MEPDAWRGKKGTTPRRAEGGPVPSSSVIARPLLLAAALHMAMVVCAGAMAQPAMVRGANVAGGDFGAVPGVYGTDYTYPTKAEIDYYADRGFNALRLPFRWERIQHDLYGDLDTVGDGTGDFERVRQVVGWITGRGMVAILDLHDYGGRNVGGVPAKVGSAALPATALADLWVRLAGIFKNDERVWFGLMNEPEGISAAGWKKIAQSVTDAIRATGARNRLLVPGTDYSGAHSWVSSGNAEQMATFVDPADNFAFEVHQYLDADSSGKKGICVPGAGASRLAPFIDWAKSASDRKGFLGEFAAGDPSVAGQEQCRAELAALLETAERSGVFIGWTAWGGGLWWEPSYIFRLEPMDLTGPETGLMRLLTPYVQ
jgi:endoglucanase